MESAPIAAEEIRDSFPNQYDAILIFRRMSNCRLAPSISNNKLAAEQYHNFGTLTLDNMHFETIVTI